MKSIFCCILTAIFLSCSVTAKAAGPIQYPPLIIEEEDGSPSVKGASKLKVTNGTLTRSGVVVTLDLSGAGGGVGFGLTDPNADRIYFWDDGAGANAFLTPGNSIAITGTTLDTIQDIRTTSTPQFARLGLGAAADATNILTVTSSSTTDLSKAINVTHTGSITGTGYGGYFSKTGASTTNVGLYATASGATNNYAAIFEAGYVGVGTTTPDAALHLSSVTTGDLPRVHLTNSSTGYTGSDGTLFGISNNNEFVILNYESSPIRFYTSGTERGMISAGGNFGFGTSSFGTSAAKVLSIGAGTAPTTSPADVTQAWTADINAVAGQNGLHIRDELGGVYKIGAGIMWGSNTEPACAAGIRGTVNYVAGGAGVADTFRVCTKDVADAYAWRVIY